MSSKMFVRFGDMTIQRSRIVFAAPSSLRLDDKPTVQVQISGQKSSKHIPVDDNSADTIERILTGGE